MLRGSRRLFRVYQPSFCQVDVMMGAQWGATDAKGVHARSAQREQNCGEKGERASMSRPGGGGRFQDERPERMLLKTETSREWLEVTPVTQASSLAPTKSAHATTKGRGG
jgi:hypothetical protein